MNKLPSTIDSTIDSKNHKIFRIQPQDHKASQPDNKVSHPDNKLFNPDNKLSQQENSQDDDLQKNQIKPKEKKALQDLLKAWEVELSRTYEHRPSPCYPINPITRRLINPTEFYDTLLRVFLINQEQDFHIDIPSIVNIFAYDRQKVFEFYEDFLNRKEYCRNKLKDYFFGKQLRFENNEWVNIPHIPLGYDFLSKSKALAANIYKVPLINSKDILEQEKNLIIIPKLITKTNKEQLFRLLDRYPEELKYFTQLEAQFFGFTKEQGEELINVYTSKDKKLIKQFRDKILKREKKIKEQKGGSMKTDFSTLLLPFF